MQQMPQNQIHTLNSYNVSAFISHTYNIWRTGTFLQIRKYNPIHKALFSLNILTLGQLLQYRIPLHWILQIHTHVNLAFPMDFSSHPVILRTAINSFRIAI